MCRLIFVGACRFRRVSVFTLVQDCVGIGWMPSSRVIVSDVCKCESGRFGSFIESPQPGYMMFNLLLLGEVVCSIRDYVSSLTQARGFFPF